MSDGKCPSWGMLTALPVPAEPHQLCLCATSLPSSPSASSLPAPCRHRTVLRTYPSCQGHPCPPGFPPGSPHKPSTARTLRDLQRPPREGLPRVSPARCHPGLCGVHPQLQGGCVLDQLSQGKRSSTGCFDLLDFPSDVRVLYALALTGGGLLSPAPATAAAMSSELRAGPAEAQCQSRGSAGAGCPCPSPQTPVPIATAPVWF